MLSMFFAVLENPNDEPLFEIFYEKYHRLVYHIAYDHVQNRESAEDCTQEVFLQLAKNFHNINRNFDDKSVLNYVRIVSKNIAIDTYRKDKKHSSRVVDTEITEFSNLKESDFDIFDEIQLKDAINSLSPEIRNVFYLKYVCNYSGEEISKALNISKPLVRKRCMLGMQRVKAYIEGEENE